MTSEEIKQAYFELLKAKLNNFHDIEDITEAPKPIQLAVEKLVKYDSQNSTIKSESLSDMSKTYADIDDLPSDVKSLVSPYRRVRW